MTEITGTENTDKPELVVTESTSASTDIDTSTAPKVEETAAQAAPEIVAAPVAETPTGFIDSLPDDLKSEAALRNFKDVKDLAKSYVSLNRMQGSSIRIPSDEASPEAKEEFMQKVESVEGVIRIPDPNNKEQVDAFYTKLGRPDKPENYDIKLPSDVPEELVNSPELDKFRQHGYNLGLNHGQVNSLVQYDLARQMAEVDRLAEEKTAGKAELKQVWGDDYEARTAAARNMADMYGKKYPGATEMMMKQHVNSPLVYIMLAELGQINQERGHIKGQGIQTFGLTPEEASARIGEIRKNPADPYNIAGHKDHDARVDVVAKLYSTANPQEGNS